MGGVLQDYLPLKGHISASSPADLEMLLWQAIEAPVRDTAPDGAGPVEHRNQGDNILTSPELNRDTEWFGTKIGFLDGMRFYGAIPEVNNCRHGACSSPSDCRTMRPDASLQPM